MWGTREVRESWREWTDRADALGRQKIPPRPLFVVYGMAVDVLIGAGGALFPTHHPWLAHGWLGMAVIASGLMLTAWVQWAIRHARTRAVFRQSLALVANGLVYGGLLAWVDGATNETARTGLFVLFVFFVSAHAFQYQVSLRTPWFLVPLVLAFVLAVVLGRAEPSLYGVTALWLLPTCVVLGNASARLDAALQSEARLRQKHAALLLELRERENARLTDFLDRLAGHTHDLGGPALALSAALERLESGDHDPELASRMAADLRALIGMITEAKGDVRRVGLPPVEPATVEEAVLAVGERIRLRYPEREVSVRPGPNAIAQARGGTSAFARAIENIAANAAAASRRRAHLTWSVSAEMVEITIEDDGPGMPPSSQIRQGGLGLASARRVLETSGGELEIDRSEELGGARVRLRARRIEAH